MDTKSKSFHNLSGVRALAFLLCVIFFAASVTGVALAGRLVNNADLRDLLAAGSYEESESFRSLYRNHLENVLQLSNLRTDYERVLKSVPKAELEDAARILMQNGVFYDDPSGRNVVENQKEQIEGVPLSNWAYDEHTGLYAWEDPAHLAAYMAEHAEEMAQIKEAIALGRLRSFERAQRELEKETGFSYYLERDGANALTNLKSQPGTAVTARVFQGEPAYLIFESGTLRTSLPDATAEEFNGTRMLEDRLINARDSRDGDLKVYLSFDSAFMTAQKETFGRFRGYAELLLPVLLGALLLFLCLFICLIAGTGRRDAEGRVKLYAADRLFTEIQIALTATGFILAGAYPLYNVWNMSFFSMDGTQINNGWLFLLDALILAVPTALFMAVGLWFLLSIVRNLKAHSFLRNLLVWKLCAALYRGIRAGFDGRNPMSKTVLLALAVCLLSATVVLAPVVFVLILVFAPRWVKKYAQLRKGVEEVKNGNLTWRIPVRSDENGEFDKLARDINEISKASDAAIRNELKNQRLKTDLISNVSHDLKTPLTSIITYIDLLKREGPDSPSAPEYIEILEQKGKRLQKLTEDLFDAAKASSGAIPVQMGRVDLLSLIRQALGEMDDGFRSRQLEVKLHAGKEKHYVAGDGQLLWRITENLLNNVQKYALEGSRVYIDLSEKAVGGGSGGMTILEIKNMSRAPLNISADELMERFKRGDESRATEGSGLGLAIARDLARLQNGWCEIKIDGDLFKAVLMLEPCEEDGEEDEAAEAV
ncbi:MAG: HAMP domain-containing histidine kinase [Clostridiales Family XIII bacterium]|nr:HAMP domain-containing histidine kinase [Clostridiales Family XIII bacterium]